MLPITRNVSAVHSGATEAQVVGEIQTPGQRVLVAQIEQALYDINSADPEIIEDAIWWLNEEEPSSWIYSFANICETLDLDASGVRNRLLAQQTEKSQMMLMAWREEKAKQGRLFT